MVEHKYNLLELLPYIHPAELEYQQWLGIGMALKEEGYSAEDWDRWSKADKRYRNGECARKWTSFRGAATPVTARTIVKLARQNGWRPSTIGGEIDWEGTIGPKDSVDNGNKKSDEKIVEIGRASCRERV